MKTTSKGLKGRMVLETVDVGREDLSLTVEVETDTSVEVEVETTSNLHHRESNDYHSPQSHSHSY